MRDAAFITVTCLVISYPIAWHMSRAQGRKALLLYACVASPLMIGVLIRNFGDLYHAAADYLRAHTGKVLLALALTVPAAFARRPPLFVVLVGLHIALYLASAVGTAMIA